MRTMLLLIAGTMLATTGPALAQPPDMIGRCAPVDIHALIEQLADEMDKEFVVDPRLRAMQFCRVANGGQADFDSLLAMLRTSQAAAYQTADQVIIVPEVETRTMPTRILQEDDPRVSDHEIVTRIIDVQATAALGETSESAGPTAAAQLMPMLRPMIPQQAHIGAIPGTNKLVLVDRYDNIRRITAVIEEIMAD